MFGRWLVVATVGVGMAAAACTAQVQQPTEQQGQNKGLLDGFGKNDGTSSTSSSSSSSSSSSGGSSSGGPKQCGISSENATCNACIQGSCCPSASACAGNTQCIELFKCVAQCQDESCTQTCAQQYPSGVAPLNAFGSCINQSCNGKC